MSGRHGLARIGSLLASVLILLGGAATATTVALAFGAYLRVFVDVPTIAAALALLTLCTLLNIWGMRESSWLNIAFTSIEVAGLLLVVAAGVLSEVTLPTVQAGAEPAVMSAAALLFFVYLGFEEIANLAEEVRNPARDIPMALFVSMGATTALYVMVAVALVSISPPAELAASEAPLTTAIENVWPQAGNLLSGIALFATANTVLITLIATSHLAFSMGRDGEIASVFARVLKGRQTPWVAALLTLAMAAVLLPVGNVQVLAEMSSFAALLAFLAVNVVLIVLRYRMPNHPRPFRVPLAIGQLPMMPLAAIVSIAVLLVHFEWRIYAAGGVALALTALAFAARQGFRLWASARFHVGTL